MVQAASPHSCILDPVFSCATAVCQQVYDLIDKIARFVFSIFTAIGEFVKSYLCCSSSQSAISTTTTQSITTSSTQPATPTVTLVTEPFLRVGPSPTGVSLEGTSMLHGLTEHLCQNEPISREFLDKHMQTPKKARQFFARLIGYLGVMCQDSKIFACSFFPSIREKEFKQNIGEYIDALTKCWQNIQSGSIDLAYRDLFLENLPLEFAGNTFLNTAMNIYVNKFIEDSRIFRRCADAAREAYLAAKASQTAVVAAPRDQETLREEQEASLCHDSRYCYPLYRHGNPLPANLSATDAEKKACARIIIYDLIRDPSLPLPHFTRMEIPSSESAPFTARAHHSVVELFFRLITSVDEPSEPAPFTATTIRRSGGGVWYHGLITALRREFADFSELNKPEIMEKLKNGSLTGLGPSSSLHIFVSKTIALAEILCTHNQGFNAAAERASRQVLENSSSQPATSVTTTQSIITSPIQPATPSATLRTEPFVEQDADTSSPALDDSALIQHWIDLRSGSSVVTPEVRAAARVFIFDALANPSPLGSTSMESSVQYYHDQIRTLQQKFAGFSVSDREELERRLKSGSLIRLGPSNSHYIFLSNAFALVEPVCNNAEGIHEGILRARKITLE